jgi:hypothetical protein
MRLLYTDKEKPTPLLETSPAVYEPNRIGGSA